MSMRSVRTSARSRARWRNELNAERPTQQVNVPPGEVRVQPKGNGWLFVQIGRDTHVKRFNITEEELKLIVAALENRDSPTQGYRGRA
jgi:hypothetical protein